ncbi:MAG: rod shape-determining protein RodA, partial [Flavobacteriales bacterium]
WVNIYAAVNPEDSQSIFNFSQEYGKQFFWICSSVFIGMFILLLPTKWLTGFAGQIYFGSLLSLILVLFIGKEIGGAKSWFSLGSFSLQPSEFAKPASLLFLASFLSIPQINLKEFKDQAIAFGILLFPMILILLQPDAGSAIVYGSLLVVLYREKLPAWYLVVLIMAVCLFVAVLLFPLPWIIFFLLSLSTILFLFSPKKQRPKRFLQLILANVSSILYATSVGFIYHSILKPHQRNRIDIILGKLEDSSGVGYNLAQSKIAIGSGGWTGKGFLNGTQTKFHFVPEQSTDFIFCTIGEEWGFLGSFLVILLFLILILRILFKAEQQKSTFTRVYGYGVACIFFAHMFINIGMTIGLLPIIGIPLPFFSYGGSSLWGFSILLFIFIRLDAQRKQIL